MNNGDRPPDLATALRTLISGGFTLEDAQRNPGYALLFMHRYDELAIKHGYCFAVAEDCFADTHVKAAEISAHHHHAHLVLVGRQNGSASVINWNRFLNLFGGAVLSISPFESDFGGHLISLGHNQLPDGLNGTADDLFESYVQAALEFAVACRVVRYGQQRRFEALPDGVVLLNWDFTFLYDAKAYEKGYPVTQASIRQFKSYVDDFTSRYGAFLPRINAFLVISGSFQNKGRTLEKRSREMLAACGVPLAFLRAEVLSQIINSLAKDPRARRSINWRRIFTAPIITIDEIEQEMMRIQRDRIIPRP